MMAKQRIEVQPLISHRIAIEEAKQAYELITSSRAPLGILLTYPEAERRGGAADTFRIVPLTEPSTKLTKEAPRVSFIGAGNYAAGVLIPAFKGCGVELSQIVSAGGVSSLHYGRKFGFAKASTDPAAVISDPVVDIIVIATRHNTHAHYVVQALEAGKHVFVEKPLALTHEELEKVEHAVSHAQGQLLMVGFNRRFAPQIRKVKELLASVSSSKVFLMTVNAGAIPSDHWIQDPLVGGGRLLGEACHFIDLLRFLAGAQIQSYEVAKMDSTTRDTVCLLYTSPSPRDS